MLKKWYRRAEGVFLFLFLFSSLNFFLYHLLYRRSVIPGVRFAREIDFTGKRFAEVYGEINKRTQVLEKSGLTLRMGEEEFPLSLNDLGASYAATESALKVFSSGRRGHLLKDLKEEARAFVFGVNVDPVLVRDEKKEKDFLLQTVSNLAAEDARFELTAGVLTVVPEKAGYLLKLEVIRKAIDEALLSLKREVSIPVSKEAVWLTAERLNLLKPLIEKRLRSPLEIGDAGRRWAPSGEERLSFFDLKKSTPERLAVSSDALGAYLERLAGEVNQSEKALSFSAREGKVLSFSPGLDGRKVDVSKAKELLERALLESPLTTSFSLPVRLTRAAVASNDYGVREMVGEGRSVFAGSILGRKHNIKTASSKLNGVLVAPGDVFSFNENVGEISGNTGYDYAYIISEGRTILGTGGGVCQVSTTLFRAALDAGLPIVKRTAHAYRVHFYEEGGSPVGLDATVFSPSVDLQFKNDTGHYLLLQSIYGEADDSLVFRLYGTKDGRESFLEGPVITSQTPAPPARYQDDPTLAKGTTRQVDFSASGASVYFKRMVKRQGQEIINETFVSNYAPWQAIYLVGTKE